MLFLALLSLWMSIKQASGACAPRTQPLDVYFAVDESGSVSVKEWDQQRVFLSKLIHYGISNANDRVGVTKWSEPKGSDPVGLTEYVYADPVSTVQQGVLTMARKDGTKTHTDDALLDALEAILAEPVLAGHKRMVVLLTDGLPTDNHGPCDDGDTTVASKFANAGVEIGVIAIGSEWVARDHLSCLVADPQNDIVQMADFSTFDQYRDPTGGFLCADPVVFEEDHTIEPSFKPTPSPTPMPTPNPTPNPTPAPSANPTPAPSANPTPAPSANPTAAPTSAPTSKPTDENGCWERTEPMDVYFAIDASASIKDGEWAQQQFFLSQLIRFGLDHPDDRVGVVSWSDEFHKHYGYDMSVTEIQAHVEANPMEQLGTYTHTDEALNFVFDQMNAEQTIPGRKRMIIMLTDGVPSCDTGKAGCDDKWESRNPCSQGDTTIPQRFQDAGIDFSILAIDDIANQPDFTKLNCLVEDPLTDIVVMDGFDSFDTYRDPTGGFMCVNPTVFTEQPTTAPTDEFGCSERHTPLDVYFAVDASGSINDDEWKAQLTFVSQLIEFGIDHPEDRVGVISWSDKFAHQYSFADSIQHVSQDVVNMVQVEGDTYTDQGINFAIEKMLAETEIVGHKRMIILLTDGVPSTSSVDPCGAGDATIPQRLTDAGIDLSILAVGGTLDFHGRLSCLVDNPQEEIVVMEDFVSFDTYRDPTGGYLCVNPNVFSANPTAVPTPAPTKIVCEARSTPLDAYFAVDGSSSIDDGEWAAQRNFISQLIRFGMDNPADRVGVTAWAKSSQQLLAYDFAHGIDRVQNDVLSLGQPDWSGTHTAPAIMFTLEKMALETPLPGHKRKLILVTDGEPSTIDVDPCLNAENKAAILTKLAEMDVSVAILAIDGSKPQDFEGHLGCLVEDVTTDITIMDDFDSFHTYRDPTGGFLCVDPVVFLEVATPAPTMCEPVYVEPESIFNDVCQNLSRKECNKNPNCVKEGKRCWGKDVSSTSCKKVRSQNSCGKLDRCRWGLPAVAPGQPVGPMPLDMKCLPIDPVAPPTTPSEATCKADFCAKYTWYGGESQCDFDLTRDGCGCKALTPDQCSSNPQCEVVNCQCQERKVCENMSVSECSTNPECLVHNGGCSKKCELGPNQDVPANVVLAFDQRSGECYLQTNVEGGCGCN